jgi:uncharacterized protein with PQ loop repeat
VLATITETVYPYSFQSIIAGGTLILFGLLDRCLDATVDCTYRPVSETLEAQPDINEQAAKSAAGRQTKAIHVMLLIWSLFGASCVVADGILTPAVSVISATTGTLSLCIINSQGLPYGSPVSHSRLFRCQCP